MKSNIEELRKKYINNPPEGLTSMDIRNMSEDELLDLDYFLNEDDPHEKTGDELLLAVDYPAKKSRI